MPRKKLTRSAMREVLRIERDKLADANGQNVKVMLSLSGGAASAVAAYRAKEWWGDRVVCVFADTCSEDDDLYRFLDDLEPIIGPIVRLKQQNDDGSDMDIWDCFDKHGIMRIQKAGGACKASVELKQKPLDDYAAANDIRLLAVGYGFLEPERIIRLNERKKDIVVLYPLVADLLLSDCDILDELKRLGVRPPRIYNDGFVHNNCLGKGGCILAGLAQFAAVKRIKPDSFAFAKRRSQAFFERTGFSVLRDQSGGTVESYTLEQLEQDIEAGRDFGKNWMSNCGCMTPLLFDTTELMDLS